MKYGLASRFRFPPCARARLNKNPDMIYRMSVPGAVATGFSANLILAINGDPVATAPGTDLKFCNHVHSLFLAYLQCGIAEQDPRPAHVAIGSRRFCLTTGVTNRN